MANQSAYSVSPVETPGIILKCIWYVDERPSYDVFVRPQRTEQVLVRTLKGTGEILLKDGTVVKLGACTTYCFDLRKAQRYRCSGDTWNFYWFEFTAPLLSHIPLFTVMNIPTATSEIKELEECFSLLRKSNPPAAMLASMLFGHLLYGYSYKWQTQTGSAALHAQAIENVVSLMHQKLSGLSIKEMAHRAYLSERRFRQVFAEVTGKAPKRFYDILRLEIAGNLLLKGNDSLEEIADRLGFSSAFHFSRAFKKHVGISPLPYRKQSRTTGKK